MKWTLRVLSCLLVESWLCLLDQLFWLALFMSLAFGLSSNITGLLLGLLIFYFFIVNLTGTLNSVTVTPIGTSCQFTTRTNPVMVLVSAWQSCQCWKVLGFALFWAFWAWSVFLVSFLWLPECSRALFDWLWPSSFGCFPVSIDFTF